MAFNFWIDSKRRPAKSAGVRSVFAAKSGRPTSPRKSVSPVNKQIGTDALSIRKKVELSRV
jgi:hypothetical protein